jgi:hypothetical protein
MAGYSKRAQLEKTKVLMMLFFYKLQKSKTKIKIWFLANDKKPSPDLGGLSGPHKQTTRVECSSK